MSDEPTERPARSGGRSRFSEDLSGWAGEPRDGGRPPSGDRQQSPVEGLEGAATELLGRVQDTARATAKAVSAQTSELADHIGNELAEAADEQRTRGADAIRGLAKAAMGAANELDGQSPSVARYIRKAAESVEGLSNTLRARSAKDLVSSASETARTHPGAFFIGAVAAGFALSRFIKSSAAPEDPKGGTAARHELRAARQDPPRPSERTAGGFGGAS